MEINKPTTQNYKMTLKNILNLNVYTPNMVVVIISINLLISSYGLLQAATFDELQQWQVVKNIFIFREGNLYTFEESK
jgi:hypothetical protein